jgi:hypothetical protein
MKQDSPTPQHEPVGFIDPENMGGEHRNGKKPRERRRVRK